MEFPQQVRTVSKTKGVFVLFCYIRMPDNAPSRELVLTQITRQTPPRHAVAAVVPGKLYHHHPPLAYWVAAQATPLFQGLRGTSLLPDEEQGVLLSFMIICLCLVYTVFWQPFSVLLDLTFCTEQGEMHTHFGKQSYT